jgi:hypothetical protein
MTYWFFSKTTVEHLKHLATVTQKLQHEKLLINMKKSSFMNIELIYLGFVILENDLRMDPDKVEVIKNWPLLKNIFEVRSFHGLASFYLLKQNLNFYLNEQIFGYPGIFAIFESI